VSVPEKERTKEGSEVRATVVLQAEVMTSLTSEHLWTFAPKYYLHTTPYPHHTIALLLRLGTASDRAEMLPLSAQFDCARKGTS